MKFDIAAILANGEQNNGRVRWMVPRRTNYASHPHFQQLAARQSALRSRVINLFRLANVGRSVDKSCWELESEIYSFTISLSIFEGVCYDFWFYFELSEDVEFAECDSLSVRVPDEWFNDCQLVVEDPALYAVLLPLMKKQDRKNGLSWGCRAARAWKWFWYFNRNRFCLPKFLVVAVL